MGAQAPGSTQFDYPMLANSLFGFKFKVITGYESTPKIHLAMERGEVQGTIATNCSTLKAISTNWITEKKIEDSGAVGAQEESRTRATSRSSSTWPRPDAERAALRMHAGAAGIRPPVLPAAERAGRAASRHCAARSTPP